MPGLPEREDAVAGQNTVDPILGPGHGIQVAGQSFAALALGGSATLKLHFVLPGLRPRSPICNPISEIALQTLPRPPKRIIGDDSCAVVHGFPEPDAEPSLSAGQTAGEMLELLADGMPGRLPVVRALELAG